MREREGLFASRFLILMKVELQMAGRATHRLCMRHFRVRHGACIHPGVTEVKAAAASNVAVHEISFYIYLV